MKMKMEESAFTWKKSAAEESPPPDIPLAEKFEEAGVAFDGSNPWDLQVHDARFWDRITAQGSLGLGESYMDGWWDCEALDEMVHRLLRAKEEWHLQHSLSFALSYTKALLLNLQRVSRAFCIGEAHYDLGNALFQRMLDRRMIYSCGYWGTGAEDLDQAQHDKLDLICRKLDLRPGMRVLDIGCGWGGFCRFAAENYGAECVGLTVSDAQARLGRELCSGHPVEIRLQDYRSLDERFDHVVSIGMFEHVGPKNYRTFMQVACRNLTNEGLMLLHTIGSNGTYRVSDPFINRYIFPHGHLPSIEQIGRSAEGLFIAEDQHNFGPDYDRTLCCWNRNFESAWPELAATKPAYDERFRRMWRFYLLSCAGAFRARRLQLWQWVFSRGTATESYRRVGR